MNNTVTTAAQPEPNRNNPLPGRDMINQVQVNSVLQIFGAAASVLIQSENLEEDRGGKLDGGTKAAIESTLIRACARLDNLLEDEPRWTLEIGNSLEAKLSEIYTQNARMLSEQANAYAEFSAPHTRLQPQLVHMSDGTWIAFCGDPSNLDNALVGAGNCPDNALKAFDALFKGEVPAHLAKWITDREASIAAGGPPLEFKQQQQPNEKTTLDEKRPEHPPAPAGRRKQHPRNSKKAGPDGAVGGEPDSR